MKKKTLVYLLLGMILLYLVVAIFGTMGHAVFAGDNADHIAQSKYIFENPDQIFGWSEICFAGYPLLFFYQPLPHILTGLLFALGDPVFVYRAIVIVLFTLIPLSFYFSTKRMGYGREMSIFSAILPLLISSFSGYGIETQSIFAWGLYTQLFATVLFPLTLSEFLLALRQKAKVSSAALLGGMLVLTHSIVGFSCFIIVGVMCLINLREFIKSLVVGAKIVLGSFLVSAFWSIPLLYHSKLYAGIIKGTEYVYSYGFFKIAFEFLTGGLLDNSMPFFVVTALGIVSIIYVGTRFVRLKGFGLSAGLEVENLRLLIYGLILSTFLFSGGRFLHSLPLFSFIELHRFIFIFHYFIILIIAYFLGSVLEQFGKRAIIALCIVLLLGLVPIVASTYVRAKMINEFQETDEIIQIAQYLRDKPDGRVDIIKPDFNPNFALMNLYSSKPLVRGMGVGRQDSFSTKYLDKLEIDKNSLLKYNIRYLIVDSKWGSGPIEKSFGKWNVYVINSSGYFLIDEMCGKIIQQEHLAGKYSAVVNVKNDCEVLLSATYSPLWKVTTDTGELEVYESNESLTMIRLNESVHEVHIHYEDVRYRKILLIFCVLFILFLIYRMVGHYKK